MNAWILLTVLAIMTVIISVMAVLSAAEASIRLVSRSRARRLIDAERPGAEALDALLERESRLVAASALARGLSYATGAVVVGWALMGPGPVSSPWIALAIGVLVALLTLFSLGEALPRAVAVHNPERVALASARPARVIVALVHPGARALGVVWLSVVGLVAKEPVADAWLTEDEYRVGGGGDEIESAREEAEEAFIDAVVEFTTKIVREVMVPRTDMVGLEQRSSVRDALSVIEETGYSRLPVYRETLDDITGVLYAKDLLVCLGNDACPASVGPIARGAYFVPETKPVEELLVEMRQRKTHIALVADEYGGTAGLVTIEDLLEEIVGEIFDEYDRAEPMTVDLGGGRLLIDGRLPIDDLNDLFGTAIELEADSVGGLFVELAGHIPEAGESLTIEGVRLTVEDVESTRIRRLVVEVGGETDKEGHHAEEPDAG